MGVCNGMFVFVNEIIDLLNKLKAPLQPVVPRVGDPLILLKSAHNNAWRYLHVTSELADCRLIRTGIGKDKLFVFLWRNQKIRRECIGLILL